MDTKSHRVVESTPATPSAVLLSPLESDFSLVLGGPLYQLWRRARVAADADTSVLVVRRVIAFLVLTWVPLVVLTIVEGTAWQNRVTVPFLRDAEIQVRLLFATPLLIVAELVVHVRMRPLIQTFLRLGLIPDDARQRFEAAVASAIRLRNSVVAELLLIAFVYGVGVIFIWRTQFALDVTSWYGVGVDGRLRPSLAGWWMGYVSLPCFQFLLLRWYFRLFIWARFLWHVSRIDLRLMPAHPDRCGGLGFLSRVSYAFSPFLVAQGAMLAGLMANQIFFSDAKFADFRVEIIGIVGIMVSAILGPMLVFSPKLAAAKRAGSREFAYLAQSYVRRFEQRWLHRDTSTDEQLLGTADLQSLADLNNSYEVVSGMRWVPFTLQTVAQLAVATLLPILPLMLTMISLEEFVDRALKAVF